MLDQVNNASDHHQYQPSSPSPFLLCDAFENVEAEGEGSEQMLDSDLVLGAIPVCDAKIEMYEEEQDSTAIRKEGEEQDYQGEEMLL